MATLRLEEIGPNEAQYWDELTARYASCQLFHRRAWLDYLAASRGANIRFWAIREGGATLGYFCGGVLRKGPFRILGSPLKGWSTNFMGPIVNEDFDQKSFLSALDALARHERFAMIEMEHAMLRAEEMKASEYESATSWTYWVALTPGNPDDMLRRMDKSRRYGIRKAIKAGLTVEDADDSAVADEYYDQFIVLMGRKGLTPPYPRSYARLLHHHLKKADCLFALRVRNPQGRLLATGLFPHDDRTVYFWGGASIPEARSVYANDFLHWQAMSMAADRGLRRYDLSGWGRFKKEFGGEYITLFRWHKCYCLSARWARKAYQFYFEKRNRLQGWVRSVQARLQGAGPELISLETL